MRKEAALLELQNTSVQKQFLEDQIRDIENSRTQQTQNCLPEDSDVLKKWASLQEKEIEKLRTRLTDVEIILKNKQSMFKKYLGSTLYFERAVEKQSLFKAQRAEDVEAENIRSLWQII